MYYLLGTQVIIELARGTDNAAARWLKRMDKLISARDIRVSTMSWAAIEIEFMAMEKKNRGLTFGELNLRERITRVFSKYRGMGAILPIDDKAVQMWVKYFQEDVGYSDSTGAVLLVGLEEKLVLATAIAGFRDIPITLVARREAIHNEFRRAGLKIEDPYAD
jgi:predicted nucleic acid-binding protein